MANIVFSKVSKNKVVTIGNLDQTIPNSVIKSTKNITLYFKDATEADVAGFKYEQNGRDLLIKNGDQTVTVPNYFTSDAGLATKSSVKFIRYKKDGEEINKSILDDGLIVTNIEFTHKKGVVSGSMFTDTIDMKNALTAPLNKNNKGLTINAGMGNDVITGTAFNDTIIGGAGVNTYNYDFESGQDTIKIVKGETLKLNLTYKNQGLECKDVNYGKLLNDLIIYREGDMSNMLNIKNFFKVNASVEIAESSLKDYLKSDDFEGINISGVGKIAGTDYNDIIMGSDKNDTITAKGGNDKIFTNGGKDTVVETGEYGHDVIDSSLSSKVTVKLSSFDANNLEYGEKDLIYTTDDKSSFTYSDFVSGETADLWINAGKKSYHVTKDNSETIDLSKDKKNNVLFLTGENQTIKASAKGINVLYSVDGTDDYTLGSNTTVIDNGADDDTYSATVTKSSKFVINDDGGNDSLTLNNSANDLVLFYNVDSKGNTDDDLVIFNKKAVSYTKLAKAYINDSYVGGVKITDYFKDNTLENISYFSENKSINIDIDGWKYLLDLNVKDYLTLINKESVKDVLENGTKKEKLALTEIFKSTTYSAYETLVSSSVRYSDIEIVGDIDDELQLIVLDDNNRLMTMNIDSDKSVTYGLGNDNTITLNSGEKYSDVNCVNDKDTLKVYGKNNILLYTVTDFVSETDSQKIILDVLDDNNKNMSISLNSLMNKEYNLGNDNVITFDSNEKYSEISFVTEGNVLSVYGKNNTLLYTVTDFVSETDSQKIILNVLDDNNKAMSINLDSLMNKNFSLGNDNMVSIINDNITPITTINGSHDTFIFEDKKYIDFYTKGELSGAYEAGDPLIAKDGNDLKIGDVTVKNIDGMTNEIQLVDMDGKTKNIIIGQGTINGTHESEIIIGSNTADTINSNGRNDLIYMGDGNDTLNMTKTEGLETGKNTAEMVGIGGTHSISNDLDVPATSVYDSTGNDTYNTTLKEFGLYIEDFAGNDTLNIKYSDDNLMYLFDVVNPKHASENPVLYTDLMICDKSQFTAAGMNAMSTATGGFKAMMESMQGTFGYAWIDDHFGNAQTIENINLVNDEGVATALDVDTAIATTKQKIAAWLATDTGYMKPSGDFSTAWDVLERGTTMDKMQLAMLYTS